MRRAHLLFVAAGTLMLAAACSAPPPPAPPEPPKPTPVERGGYLVATSGCHDCHTPWKMGANGQPEPDMTRALSGHPEGMQPTKPPKMDGIWVFAGAGTFTAWTGPWGISFTANLTPDQNTGLGIWTEDMFVRAIRDGKHMGTSRPILPPMPWPAYRNMTDEDLKAIFAYLKTIPAIRNQVPEPYTPEQVAKMK